MLRMRCENGHERRPPSKSAVRRLGRNTASVKWQSNHNRGSPLFYISPFFWEHLHSRVFFFAFLPFALFYGIIKYTKFGYKENYMSQSVVLLALNAKYIHMSPAPWCLAAGVKAYAPQFYTSLHLLDATINQPQEQVLQRILAHSPQIVGFSCYIWNIDATLALCMALKQHAPQITIVLGGPEVSFCAPDLLAQHPYIDYISRGEGERSFPAFLGAFYAKQSLHTAQIAGLCGRLPEGAIFTNPIVKLQNPIPSPLTAGYATMLGGRIAYLETSRDCPYACAFCLSGRDEIPRFFPLDTACADLLTLAQGGSRTIKLIDRTFNANPKHCNAILQHILAHYGKGIPHGVCFHLEIAGDILQESTFALLAKMPVGAVQLEIGMQSFHEPTLVAIHRKTNTVRLCANIKRLLAMGNMHVHIDLIAGLPYEDINTFAQSFTTGYQLGAHMLQMGFLKLLHGSAMRSCPDAFPCTFSPQAPYAVTSTPWLSPADLAELSLVEHALDRTYNSGRFCRTLAYVLENQPVFLFFLQLGQAMQAQGIVQGTALDDFTAFFQAHCLQYCHVQADALRDCLVLDRLSTNATGRLPKCLILPDAKLAIAKKALQANPATAQSSGVVRGIALLYGRGEVAYVDYTPATQHGVTGAWKVMFAQFPNER